MENTRDNIRRISDDLTATINKIEISTNTDIVKQQYSISHDYFYNGSNIWVKNESYSTTLKMVELND